MDVIRLDDVMTASIDVQRSTAHHVAEKDRYGNEEPSCSQSVSEGAPEQEPEAGTFQSSKKLSRSSPWKRGRIPMQSGRQYCLFLPLACPQFHIPPLVVVETQHFNEDQNIFHDEPRTQNEEDVVSAL